MRINGEWLRCTDGIVRPIVIVEVLDPNSVWREVRFLIDTAADRTVFTAELLADLGLPSISAGVLTGVGGTASLVEVSTKIRLQRDDGGLFTIQHSYGAFTDPFALDMSVLGRDVLDLFAVIVDRPRDVVCLLAQHHQYIIQFV